MLHRMEAVEHIGSGIRRIRNLCRDYGVAEPQIEVSEHWFTLTFPRPGSRVESQQPESTPHVTPHVTKLVLSLVRDMNRDELMKIVGLKDRKYFMGSYLKPAFDAGLVEMTIPDKPRSRVQCYRLTLRGIELQQSKQERP
ncbi:MAG: hypothetical protein LAC69_07125 [Chlorobium sp.]|nr:hypothetical protein [Chlorobium sp.]